MHQQPPQHPGTTPAASGSTQAAQDGNGSWLDPWAQKGQGLEPSPPQGLLAKGRLQGASSADLCPRSCWGWGLWCSIPQTLPGSSLTCCSSNSVENRWVTDKISREKEKEPPPYLGEQRDG